MNKIQIKQMVLTAAAALIMPAAFAQTTQATVETIRMESLWSTKTNNAAGGMIDAYKKYAMAEFSYNKVDGDFKYTQLGDDNSTLKFHTEGGGIYEKVNGMYLWGEFTYTRDDISGARWNSTLIDPLRGMPFYIADATPSDWKNQNYKMAFQAGFPKLLDCMYLGIGGSYEAAQGAKQIDPRPLTKLSSIEVIPSVIFEIGKNHHAGANFYYRSYREDGTATCMNPVSQPVWDMVAPGYFTPGIISNATNTVNPLRSYNANTLGGGLQYGLNIGNLEALLSGNYSYKVEDVFCNYTYPQMSGTVKESVWDLTLALKYRFKNNNLLTADYTHRSRDTKGLEYFQTYDNSSDVQSWITDAIYERSNFNIGSNAIKIDYLVSDKDMGYKWKMGIEGNLVTDDYTYYLPESNRNVKYFEGSGYVSRNQYVSNKSSFLFNLHGKFRKINDSKFDYNGTRADDIAFTEFAMVDFMYMCTSYISAGIDVTYNLQGLFKNTSTFYTGICYDYISPRGNIFDKRQSFIAKIGIMF